MIGFYGFESEYRGFKDVFSAISALWQWLASVWHRLASVAGVQSLRNRIFWSFKHQRLLRPREYDVRRSRIHESKISAGTELQISELHEAWTSRTPEVMSSWSLELMTPRAHDFGTSGVLDVWRLLRCQDFNPYWFPGIIISWWIEFKIYSLRFDAVLFPISVSGTGGSPLQIGRRTSGNGAWYSTRFWVPGTLYVSGLSKLCFPLREIDFVTENSLPARGWKTPPKSSFFTGHPMCRDRILTAEGFPTPSFKNRDHGRHNCVLRAKEKEHIPTK